MEENKTLEMNTEMEERHELVNTSSDEHPTTYEENETSDGSGFVGIVIGAAAIGGAFMIGKHFYKKFKDRKKGKEFEEAKDNIPEDEPIDVEAEEVEEEPEEDQEK